MARLACHVLSESWSKNDLRYDILFACIDSEYTGWPLGTNNMALPSTLHDKMNRRFYGVTERSLGDVGVSCAIFCFRAPSRRTIGFACLRLGQVKIYKFGHIMCNFWLHGTAVELTVACWKKKFNGTTYPTVRGKLCQSVMFKKVYANALKVKGKCC